MRYLYYRHERSYPEDAETFSVTMDFVKFPIGSVANANVNYHLNRLGDDKEIEGNYKGVWFFEQKNVMKVDRDEIETDTVNKAQITLSKI